MTERFILLAMLSFGAYLALRNHSDRRSGGIGTWDTGAPGRPWIRAVPVQQTDPSTERLSRQVHDPATGKTVNVYRTKFYDRVK